jgi:hypothetical protein
MIYEGVDVATLISQQFQASFPLPGKHITQRPVGVYMPISLAPQEHRIGPHGGRTSEPIIKNKKL